MFYIGRAALRPFLKAAFGYRVIGAHNFPAKGAVLIVSNHLSAWDTVLIPSAVRRPVQFLTKAGLYTKKGPIGRFLKWFFTSIGGVPVHRSAGTEAFAALHAGSSVLRAGGVFGVFPEGTRSRDGKLYKGRTGAAWMALDTGANVVPVGLVGIHNLAAFGWLVPGRARPEVRIGPPVELGDLIGLPGSAPRRQATDRIIDAIGQLSGQERDNSVNSTSADAARS